MTTPQRTAVTLRYRRVVPFLCAVVVTLTALLGGVGLLPSGGSPSYAATQAHRTNTASPPSDGAMSLSADTAPQQTPAMAPQQTPATAPQQTPATAPPSTASTTPGPASAQSTDSRGDYLPPSEQVPADSGTGRRVVFDISAQRVWLVDGDGTVARTYLVSGSLTDNLKPGTYQVESRQMDAIGVDNSGTMHYFVVFTHGVNAAIGFHDLPVKDGKPVQTRAQLGTPQSHGCVRQWRPDAKALWRFAPLGTTVVVTA